MVSPRRLTFDGLQSRNIRKLLPREDRSSTPLLQCDDGSSNQPDSQDHRGPPQMQDLPHKPLPQSDDGPFDRQDSQDYREPAPMQDLSRTPLPQRDDGPFDQQPDSQDRRESPQMQDLSRIPLPQRGDALFDQPGSQVDRESPQMQDVCDPRLIADRSIFSLDSANAQNLDDPDTLGEECTGQGCSKAQLAVEQDLRHPCIPGDVPQLTFACAPLAHLDAAGSAPHCMRVPSPVNRYADQGNGQGAGCGSALVDDEERDDDSLDAMRLRQPLPLNHTAAEPADGLLAGHGRSYGGGAPMQQVLTSWEISALAGFPLTESFAAEPGEGRRGRRRRAKRGGPAR